MLLGTQYGSSNVYNHGEMSRNLEQLAEDHRNATLVSVGKTEGYGGTQNALDIWALHIAPTSKATQTLFFVGGQHRGEYSGSVTPYEIGKRLLLAHQADNRFVRKMLAKLHVIVIPQVDSDCYGGPVEAKAELADDEYWRRGYGLVSVPWEENGVNLDEICNVDDQWKAIARRLGIFHSQNCPVRNDNSQWVDCLGKKHTTLPRRHDVNFYGPSEDYPRDFPPLQQSTSVRQAVESFTTRFGPPFLAFDYHEGPAFDRESKEHRFEVVEWNSGKLAQYALKEVSASYPVSSRDRGDEPDIHPNDNTFCSFLASKGARSFLFETPRSEDDNLAAHVGMNLIATDRILAKYCLGI